MLDQAYAAYWPMDPAIEAFETLASERVTLGNRYTAAYDRLIHPVRQHGRVFAWKVRHPASGNVSGRCLAVHGVTFD